MDKARFEAEIADLPTSRLEEMYFRDIDAYIEDARSLILKVLDRREDRRIGIAERYCSACKRLNDMKTLTCTCGFNFHAGVRPPGSILKDKKRAKMTRLTGLVFTGLAGLYGLLRWDRLLNDAASGHTPFLFGFWLLCLGCGLYMLFTGDEADPMDAASKAMGLKRDKK